MQLKVNQNSPEFNGIDLNGKTISLNNYKNKKVLISFLRGASCAFCNMRVHELIKNYSELQKNNIEIITVFTSSKTEMEKYVGKQQAPFPMVPNPSLSLYKKFGVEYSHLGMFVAMFKRMPTLIKSMGKGMFGLKSLFDVPSLPADFLINEKGGIEIAYYGKDYGDHLTIDDIFL